MKYYRVFTVQHDRIQPHATARPFEIAGGSVKIHAVLVGERGRGRELGVLPVWFEAGKPAEDEAVRFSVAAVGKTRAGKPKLLVPRGEVVPTDEAAVVVLLTEPGFRGGCNHTGDRAEVWYELDSFYSYPNYDDKDGSYFREHIVRVREVLPDLPEDPDEVIYMLRTRKFSYAEAASLAPIIAQAKWMEPQENPWPWKRKIRFRPFPGQVLVSGYTAQGDAGRMGGGAQIVALVPRGVVFRAGRSGRLYGAPAAHYYVFDGERVLTATWEERELLPDEHPLAIPENLAAA